MNNSNSTPIYWVERTDPFMAIMLGKTFACNEARLNTIKECNAQDVYTGSFPRFKILD